MSGGGIPNVYFSGGGCTLPSGSGQTFITSPCRYAEFSVNGLAGARLDTTGNMFFRGGPFVKSTWTRNRSTLAEVMQLVFTDDDTSTLTDSTQRNSSSAAFESLRTTFPAATWVETTPEREFRGVSLAYLTMVSLSAIQELAHGSEARSSTQTQRNSEHKATIEALQTQVCCFFKCVGGVIWCGFR
jgi:hypothetical protein